MPPSLRRQLDRLRELLSRATRAPWHIEAVDLTAEGRATIEDHPAWHRNPWHTTVGWSPHDREYVQDCVRLLPELLDLVDRQEGALREVREQLATTLASHRGGLIEVSGLQRALTLVDSLSITKVQERPRRKTGS